MLRIKETRFRCDFKKKLLDRNIIPYTTPYNKDQEKIIDLLKAGKYEEIKTITLDKFNIDLDKRLSRTPIKRIISTVKYNNQNEDKEKPLSKSILKILIKLETFGLVSLNEDLETDIQKEIKNKVIYDKIPMYKIIDDYIDESNDYCKQVQIYNTLKGSNNRGARKNKGYVFDIAPENIIINKYCPFLGTEISYKKGDRKISPTKASADRFNNAIGYVDGNVWTISKLANTIKNSATVEELKIFCINVIKIYHENHPN